MKLFYLRALSADMTALEASSPFKWLAGRLLVNI
jgi:hypothetical protein